MQAIRFADRQIFHPKSISRHFPQFFLQKDVTLVFLCVFVFFDLNGPNIWNWRLVIFSIRPRPSVPSVQLYEGLSTGPSSGLFNRQRRIFFNFEIRSYRPKLLPYTARSLICPPNFKMAKLVSVCPTRPTLTPQKKLVFLVDRGRFRLEQTPFCVMWNSENAKRNLFSLTFGNTFTIC